MRPLLKLIMLCMILLLYKVGYSQLYINEVMANNSSVIADEQGDFDDWIEIYNAGTSAIDLGGYYLTDDGSLDNLWQIPTDDPAITTIAAGEFILLWADKDIEDGPLHLDFKLSSNGEEVLLIDVDGSTIINSIELIALGTNISYGRTQDGGSDFQTFLNVTPGGSNENPLASNTFPVVINQSVITVNDDAIQFGVTSGGVMLDAFGMTLTESWSNQTIGVRFSDIYLPPGAIINTAHIQFTTKNPDNSTGYSRLRLKAETSGNATPFEEINFNLSDRPLTTDSIIWEANEWTIQDFAGTNERSPNLAPLIQEVVDQGNWSAGNALAFIITGEGERSAHNYTSGFPPTIEITAQVPVPTDAISGLYINEIAPNGTEYQDEDGKYGDWIEIYNSNSEQVILGGLYLSDDPENPTKWQIASVETVPANGFATIWADNDPERGGFHANFQLDENGETLIISQGLNNQLTIIDSFTYNAVPFKASTGRTIDGGIDWTIFGAPTPKATNVGALPYLAPPAIELDFGVFDTPQTVAISHEDPQAIIYYTTDGSNPNETSLLYQSPVTIDQTQSLRAIAYKAATAPSQITTKTYLFDASASLPVLMITTDPDNLWDDEIGIYTVGTNGTLQGFCSDSIPANYWQVGWERPAHISFYEPDGTVGFAVNAGVQISGNCSRKYALKSLNFYLRSSQYGDNNIDYQLFANRDHTDYDRLRLRNSGQDYRGTMLRDGVNQRILADATDVEYQSMRPTLVYINGEYWGIQNLRESYSTSYFERLFDTNEKELELLKSPRLLTEIKEGNDIHYNALYDFMAENDLSDPASFEYVTTQFEIDNFLDYWISMLYMSNADWPSNNVQIWREQKDDAKWRYMFMDTDLTTNMYGSTSPNGHTWDRITEVLDSTFMGWPNDSRATLPFRKIIQNQQFKEEFIQRSCTYMELVYNADRALSFINEAANEIDSEIGAHVENWAFDNPFLTEYDHWVDNTNRYREFWQERPAYFFSQLFDVFEQSDTFELSFNYDESTNGDVLLHWKDMSIPFNYSGTYFTGLPIRVTAVADEGYEFSHWLETGDSTAVIEFIANEDASLTPIFKEIEIIIDNTEEVTSDNIHIFPNPSQGILFLETTGSSSFEVEQIEIYNQLGQLVFVETINTNTNNHLIRIDDLSDGLYFLILKVRNNLIGSKSFVLKR